jgi:hypothetical protein
MPRDINTWQLKDVLFLHQNDKHMEEARERIQKLEKIEHALCMHVT